MPQFLKSEEIASRYGVSVETVRAWARRRWIPVLRAGRRPMLFDPDEVDQALRARGKRNRDTGTGESN
jgi:excisionase family DNA binding protein